MFPDFLLKKLLVITNTVFLRISMFLSFAPKTIGLFEFVKLFLPGVFAQLVCSTLKVAVTVTAGVDA